MKKTIAHIIILAFVAAFSNAFSQQHQKKLETVINRDPDLPGITVNFNPVGFLLYGPIIQAEFKVAHRSYIVPWLRYNYLGLSSQFLWTSFEDDNVYSPASFSVAAGFRQFELLRSKERLMYYGLFGEYNHEKAVIDRESFHSYEQTRLSVSIYGNIGYRMELRNDFYINLGILPGLNLVIENEGTYSNNGDTVTGLPKKGRIVGMLDVAIGWHP